MELLSDLDLGSLSDNDLQHLIGELTDMERAVSRERRLLHKCLGILGVDRLTQTAGVPFDGWVGTLVQRENEVSYDRSLVQGRLDILKAERKERKRGRSRGSLGAEALTKALSRHGCRPKARPTTS
jgi:RsiG-like